MPYLSERDKSDLLFGIKTGFDIVAASFVTRDEDIIQIRKLLDENGGKDISIIAKIENQDGVDNIDDILRVADGIMVARGDMGVEIPFVEIPRIQKELIHKGYNAGKQVITATQMLDSMIKNPRPTRAETTDVANAIYDGTSAIMLSGETAAGAYPIDAVKTMKAIAVKTEQDIDYRKRFFLRENEGVPNVTNAIAHATVTTSIDLGATAILTVTKGGRTARTLSKFRPTCPIIAATTSERAQRQLNLSWGVIPIKSEEMSDSDSLFDHAVTRAMEEGLLKDGDLIVITAGLPLGVSVNHPAELALIRHIAALPNCINEAAKDYNPSKITKYLCDLAQLFHKFYDNCKIKGEEENILQSRLSLCVATKTVFKNLLDLLKVDAPEKM